MENILAEIVLKKEKNTKEWRYVYIDILKTVGKIPAKGNNIWLKFEGDYSPSVIAVYIEKIKAKAPKKIMVNDPLRGKKSFVCIYSEDNEGLFEYFVDKS